MIFIKFDRRIFHYFDWILLSFVLGICVMGVLNIYSTGFSAAGGQSPFYLKQLQWIVVGLLFMTFVFFMDYRVIVEYAYICLLYTSDAADDLLCVDLGGRRIIKKKKPLNKIRQNCMTELYTDRCINNLY